MTVAELKRVLNMKFKIKYINRWTLEEINISDLDRYEKLRFNKSPVYMIYPTNIPTKIEVVVSF